MYKIKKEINKLFYDLCMNFDKIGKMCWLFICNYNVVFNYFLKRIVCWFFDCLFVFCSLWNIWWVLRKKMICKSVVFNNKLIFVGIYDGFFFVFCCKVVLYVLLEFNRILIIYNIINNVCLFFVFGLKIWKKYIFWFIREEKIV